MLAGTSSARLKSNEPIGTLAINLTVNDFQGSTKVGPTYQIYLHSRTIRLIFNIMIQDNPQAGVHVFFILISRQQRMDKN